MDQTVNTDSGMATGTATWTTPTASDNSGSSVNLTPDYSPGHAFPIGATNVTYTATDGAGNSDTCTFTITVNGEITKQKIFSTSFYQA